MTRIGRTSRRSMVISGTLSGVAVLLGIAPWRLAATELNGGDQPSMRLAESARPAVTPPMRTEGEHFAIEVLENGSRVAGFNKLTGERKSLDIRRNAWVTEVVVGDNIAACVMSGTPVSKLILYNGRIGAWSTFPLSMRDRALNVCPIVSDHIACYQLKDRIVAYSETTDTWGMLSTDATPAVGDDSVVVNTATETSAFTAKSGVWTTAKTPAVTRQ
jgi:hypothetical protein